MGAAGWCALVALPFDHLIFVNTLLKQLTKPSEARLVRRVTVGSTGITQQRQDRCAEFCQACTASWC